MTQSIVNGAGTMISLGTNDLSKTIVPVSLEQIPQHLPIFFIFAPRGNGKFLVNGNAANKIFGELAFDPRGPYYNHATHFALKAMGNANQVMLQRVVPSNAGPKSNTIIWLDVLETTVDLYRRNPDGSILLNNLGEPEVIDTAPGLKVKFVKTHRTTLVAQEDFGDKTQVAGDQVDPDTNDQSVRYPLFEIEEDSFGDDGNNTGFRLWAPSTRGGNVLPKSMMQKYQAYPYFFSVVSRKDAQSTVKYEKTITGETQVLFTFKKGVVNPTTNQRIGYDQILLQSYNQIDVPGYPNIYGRIGRLYVYDANIEAVLALMYQYESDFIDSNSDITEDASSKGLLNFVTGASSSGVPYQTYVFVDSVNSVRLSQSSPVFFEGGSDGTMSNANYETLVSEQMDRYADADDPVQDPMRNVESIVYDSGFTLQTKFDLAKFISVRKNTSVVVGTHTVGEPALTEAEEHATAVSLRTAFQLYPESDYFGTPVCRAMIQGCSGITRDSEYTERIPATYEILDKFSRYMGAGNGAWKSGESPEGNPGNRVTLLKNINVGWIPDSSRNRNWDAGLNWILTFDRDDYFIPSYKTVYNNDTSVLNSMLTVIAIAELNRVGYTVWRDLTGRSDLSDAQLVDRTNKLVRERTRGRFDNRFGIIPAATVTEADKLRGFSWSLPIKLGAENMKTVMTTYVEAYRNSDLVPTSTNANGG